LWHHQHIIEPTDDEVLMTTILLSQLPFGLLSAIANLLLIKNKLNEIFNFGTHVIEQGFGLYK
jgi:hypothetical protein|tara:strand:- start:51 stop:239 length:189 start_codon:yes stop_codon:yes gene_type:complete